MAGPENPGRRHFPAELWTRDLNGVAQCATELITIVDPLQIIVLLEHRSSHFQVFLRYESATRDKWRFSGAYAPFVKYFRPDHRIERLGPRPFLVVTGQGNAGTGLSSREESWIDLTREEFTPALSFTSEGHLSHWAETSAVKSEASLHLQETAQVERITVSMSIK